MKYAVGVRGATTVWWGNYQPLAGPTPLKGASGRPSTRIQRDPAHQPISVAALAQALPPKNWRTVSWRQGTSQALTSRFARVRAAHRDQPRDEEWLIIEWAPGAAEPAHYWFSNLPQHTGWQAMINTVMSRWQIEQDYEELKQEMGLGHFEGRNWRGFHHHASLCIAAYDFLMLERLSGRKKTPLDSKRLPYPPSSSRAGLGPMQRHEPTSIASCRFRLGRAIARALSNCPCCGRGIGRLHS